MQSCPIIGYEPLCVRLLNQMRNSKAGHAYLFVGPAAVGKKTAARWLATQLESCETITIESEDSSHDSGGGTIGIERIRALRDTLSHSSMLGVGMRTVIIDPIEAMNESAGNALLKTLEEPPPNTLFILVATDLARISGTIRSRVAIIRFPPLGRSALKKAGFSDANQLDYALGRVGKALEYYATREEVNGNKSLDGILDAAPSRIGEQLLEFQSADAHILETMECMLTHQIRNDSMTRASIAAFYEKLVACQEACAYTKSSNDLLVV